MRFKLNKNLATHLAILVSGIVASSSVYAGPMAQQLRTDAILISDMSLDGVYITRDFNANGNANDAGEANVYFDANNFSGLLAPSNSVFSLFQSQMGHVYIGDGGSDSVYRLSDWNADGDAQDAGEARVWFSEANAGGFTLPTPNSVYEAQDGALYVANAGTRSRPTDAIYRTIDLNNDGDANDVGEAAIWLDLSTLASARVGGAVPDNKSSAFDITFIDDTAYIADLMGGETDTIFIARDADGNGSIGADELNVFIDDDNLFGVSVATGLISDEAGSLYTLESGSSKDQSIYRLNDLNGNGVIDDVSEVQEIWNEFLVDALAVELGSAFSLAVGPDGELTIVSAGSDIKDNVFRLLDLNGDGDFFDAGETTLWASGNGRGAFADFARTAEYINVVAPVPLPAPLLLLVSGLALLLTRFKQRP